MDFFHLLMNIIGSAIGIYAHIPMWKDIIKNDSKSYSATSYGLWSLLDFIAARAIFEQDGNYLLPLIYGICAGITAVLLIYKKLFNYSWVESLVIVLIVATLGAWYIYDSYVGLICSIVSLTVASVPQIKDFAINPNKNAFKVYRLFFWASLISCFGARSLSLAELSYPLTATTLCGIMMYLANRKTPLVQKEIIL